jgi:hypothetical protein
MGEFNFDLWSTATLRYFNVETRFSSKHFYVLCRPKYFWYNSVFKLISCVNCIEMLDPPVSWELGFIPVSRHAGVKGFEGKH